MGRPSATRVLSVWMNGERVGAWSTRPSGPDQFLYAPEWLASEDARPISLSMPLRPTAYKGDVVSAYFDNLLPESRAIRERLRRRFAIASASPFALLAEIGRDCVGAIQLLPGDADPPEVRNIEGRSLTDREIEAHLAELSGAPMGRADDNMEFRFSLAGAQEKAALLRRRGKWMRPLGTTPTTHILKLPIGGGGGGIDLSTSVENEWLCARILKDYGVPVAECEMADFGARRVLVVERFDRRPASRGDWIVRLPVEDLCQATGTPATRKYESDGGPGIRQIMSLLLGSSQAGQDRRDFFRTQMLFWMLCAIDGHAKNFSLFLEAGGAYRLAPRYDVLSAYPVLGTSAARLQPRKVRMAMAVEGASRHYRWHDILPRHWQEVARRSGIGAEFRAICRELIDQTPAAIERATADLPRGFPASVVGPVVDGLRKSSKNLATMR
ncbi:MAG: type II toxin-antitoxin system HipA family toxin [bacterium]